ncbi:hypothetical protein UNH65_04110 [Chitinophaga sp. 180180018-2]|nr:hypothetical protein [Chitinophaga sp. 212800010-3]
MDYILNLRKKPGKRTVSNQVSHYFTKYLLTLKWPTIKASRSHALVKKTSDQKRFQSCLIY